MWKRNQRKTSDYRLNQSYLQVVMTEFNKTPLKPKIKPHSVK